MRRSILANVVLIIFAHAAGANVRPTFGPEFTFAIRYLHGDVTQTRILNRAKEHLIDGQSQAEKFRIQDVYRLVSPRGWWFYVDTDGGVAEITMKPLPVAKWRQYATDIQDAVFVSAYNVNALPQLFKGGGHINIGIDELLDHPLLLRNFIVDHWNNNQLSMGMFGYDTHNAISFWLLSPEKIKAVTNLISEFDRDLIAQKVNRHDALSFLTALRLTLFHGEDAFSKIWDSSSRAKKNEIYFSESFAPNGRIEIRAVRPQLNMTVWLNQISLIQGRLNYLAQFKHPIPLEPRVAISLDLRDRKSVRKAKLNPPVSPREALKAFYLYVQESGESWKDHRDYIWPRWKTDGELRKFERSVWFKKQKCGGYL